MGTIRIYVRTALAGFVIAAVIEAVAALREIRPRDLRFVALALLFALVEALSITRNVLREHTEELEELALSAAERPVEYSWIPQTVVEVPPKRSPREPVVPLATRVRRSAYRIRVRSSGISSPIRSLFR